MKIHFQEGDYFILKKSGQIVTRRAEPVNYSFSGCILNVHRNWLGEGNWAQSMPQILHDNDGWTWTFETPNNRTVYLTIERNGEYLPRATSGVWNHISLGDYSTNQYYGLFFDHYDGNNAVLEIRYGTPFDYHLIGTQYYYANYYLGYSGPLNESYETGVNKLLNQYNFGLVQSILDTQPFSTITGVWKPRTDTTYPFSIGSDYLVPMSGYSTGSLQISKELIIPDPTDPYEGGGISETGGGDGDFDGTSDPIDFPSLPALGAVDSGFITLFNPDLNELQALARYMWTNPLFDISAWKKIFADPMDAIIGLSIVPVAVPDSPARPIIVGNIITDVSMKVATTQFIEVQCGALNVNEFWGAYLDYDPYTKAEIYLPFCGVHQLAVDDIMGKTVEVRYHIDILSGACCAFVKCGESVLYQFIGQCASSIPISGTDFTNVINGVLSAATAIGSLVATGGASAPLAVPALSATAANALKPNIEKSGSMGGTGGMLAILKPYLILTRPKQALPENQNHFTGYPSFITENLGDLNGYTEIEKIHLEGISATDDELSEIETLLKGGVIL